MELNIQSLSVCLMRSVFVCVCVCVCVCVNEEVQWTVSYYSAFKCRRGQTEDMWTA